MSQPMSEPVVPEGFPPPVADAVPVAEAAGPSAQTAATVPPWGPGAAQAPGRHRDPGAAQTVETAPSAVQPIAPEPAAAPTAIPVPQPIVPAKTQDAAPAAPAATAATPWAKAAGAAATPWAQRRGPVKPRATARLRKTIEGLPDWEPLPPGEIFVQRGRGDG